eukprot:UN18348
MVWRSKVLLKIGMIHITKEWLIDNKLKSKRKELTETCEVHSLIEVVQDVWDQGQNKKFYPIIWSAENYTTSTKNSLTTFVLTK